MRLWASLFVLLSGLLVTAGFSSPAQADGSTSTIFVVDTSGSMSGSPLDQAKSALTEVNNNLTPGSFVGLRSFGGSCGDGGRLLIPVGAHDPQTFGAAVGSLTAGGGTPTPDALRAAVLDLPTSGARQVVLISDGQSSCGDPCVVARELKAGAGVDFVVHTVGYNVGSTASSELTCIAQETGGTYHDVTDGTGLADAIGSVTSGSSCPDYRIFGVRGSGQTASEYDGFGYEVYLATDAIEDGLRTRSVSFRSTPLNYASLPVGSLVDDAFSWIGWPFIDRGWGQTTTEYADSMWGASTKLMSEINAYELACQKASKKPGQVIAVGYSQGAAAVNWMSHSLTREQQGRTTLVLIGDPLRHPDDEPRFKHGSAKSGKGLLQVPQTPLNTTFTALSIAAGKRTVQLCDDRDIVCDTKRAILFNEFLDMAKQHTSYRGADLRAAGTSALKIATEQKLQF